MYDVLHTKYCLTTVVDSTGGDFFFSVVPPLNVTIRGKYRQVRTGVEQNTMKSLAVDEP